MTDPILDLTSVIPEKKQVRIDGVGYDLQGADDLSLAERAKINRQWARAQELSAKEDPTETDETEFKDLVESMVRTMLPDAPLEVLRKLGKGSQSQQAIIVAFFAGSLPMMEKVTRLVESPSIGMTSLQDSNGSTNPATQDAG